MAKKIHCKKPSGVCYCYLRSLYRQIPRFTKPNMAFNQEIKHNFDPNVNNVRLGMSSIIVGFYQAEGVEAMRYFCTVGTMIRWLLLSLLTLTSHLAGSHKES